MQLEELSNISDNLAMMPDPALQQFAQMHKSDPYMVSLALSESNRRKKLRTASQGQAGAAPQPKVVDAAIQGMTPAPVAQTQLPENQGIAQIPAPNMRRLADGGIAGYGDDEEQGMATGGMGGMSNFAQQSEPVIRMSGGGMPGYKNGGLTDKQEFAAQYKDIAEKVGKELGVDPGILISQWGLETAWGKKPVGQYNLGNIKDVTGKGPVAYDKLEKSKASYKSYESPDAFAADYAALIKRNFPKAVGAGSDIGAFSAGLQSGTKGAYATDPNYRKSLASTYKSVTDLLPMGSAEAGTLPQQAQAAAPAQAQKPQLENAEDAGYFTRAGMGAATMGAAGLQSLKDVFTAGFKPGTTAGQAGRVLGTAAAVPQAVIQGGYEASKKAMNDLQYMSEDQRRALAANPMLSAMSGDAGLASAIMDAAANNPEGPSKMPYSQQMANVGKTILQHPDIDRMREANKAKQEKAVAPKDDPLNRVPVSPDEFGSAVGIPDVVPDLNKKQMDNLAEKAKEATPVEARKGLTNDDYLMMGLSLLANKSPNLATAFGEAGVQTLGAKRAREKDEREEAKYKSTEELQKAQARQYGAYADLLERGGKEKKLEFEAEKEIGDRMAAWDKANKVISIQDPMARLQEENRIRQQIYASLGLKPIMTGQAAPAGAGDFKIVGVR
jgi:flagellum-specific peptidoglycan hydrolase FlgJ